MITSNTSFSLGRRVVEDAVIFSSHLFDPLSRQTKGKEGLLVG